MVSSQGLFGIPYFSMLAVLIFTSVIMSRNGHLNLAIAINLLIFSLYPYVSLIIKETWSLEYSFLILVWVPITMLIGGYLLNQREAALFIATHDVIFLFVVLVHPGASLFMSAFLESILPLFTISLLIFVGSWARQRHMNQLEKFNHELDAKNRELNIYTSLLTHDIGNDLQICVLNTEITSDLLVTDPTSARNHILTALTVGQRMSALLKVFSDPQITMRSDIVSLIERIAEQTQITHGNLEVVVTADEQCRSYGIVSRLLPMVFANLFRNSATHAGKTPTVEVSITMNENIALIAVNDDGPGVDPSIRDSLFEKGVTGTKSAGTGMGLYLIKQILETHNGTISLLDEDECDGCGFRITLPCTSFAKLA
jgi:signal transduction histidine kinase